MIRLLCTLLLGGLLVPPMVGCDRSSALTGGRQPVHGAIVLVGAGQTDPEWPIVRAGFLAFGKDFVSSPVQAVAPPQPSPSEQIKLIQQVAEQGAVGLCIVVTDVEAMTHIIDRLFLSGISIVTVHRDAPDSRRTAFVGVDQFKVGEAIADALASGLADRKNVMLLHAGLDDATYAARYYGFKRVLERRYPDVALLHEWDCDQNPFAAEDIIREQMSKYPRLGGWGILGDWPLRYLQGKPPLVTPGCLVVGYGPYPKFWPLIEDGTCHAMVGADYFEMGYKAASICREAVLHHSEIPEYNIVPTETVTFTELLQYRQKWQHWLELGQPAETK